MPLRRAAAARCFDPLGQPFPPAPETLRRQEEDQEPRQGQQPQEDGAGGELPVVEEPAVAVGLLGAPGVPGLAALPGDEGIGDLLQPGEQEEDPVSQKAQTQQKPSQKTAAVPAGRRFRNGRGSGREVLAVIQQDLRRDAEEAAEGQEAPQLRLSGAKLPAGDSLAGDPQLFRQGLLGETAALAQGQELFRQFHGVPSFHRVASG